MKVNEDSPTRAQNDYYLITNSDDEILSSIIYSRSIWDFLLLNLKIVDPDKTGGKAVSKQLSVVNAVDANIYPNPASNSFSVDIYNVQTSQPITLSITDVMGRVYITDVIHNPSTDNIITKDFETTALQAGIYSVTIRSSDFVLSKKLTVL